MKYFTKYLPVPGEIKEGNTFVCVTPHGDKYVCSSIKNRYVYTSPLPFRFRIKDCIVLKLFLCSRDIRVGDKFRMAKLLEREYTAGEEYQYQDGDFKVIGEVSPNAIWVKEGMEFDEDQISEYFGFRNTTAIRCPTCNTFH